MAPEIQKLLDEASKLSAEQRALLREGLQLLDDDADEDPAEVEKAWIEEVRRRRSEADAGREPSVSWDEFQQALTDANNR